MAQRPMQTAYRKKVAAPKRAAIPWGMHALVFGLSVTVGYGLVSAVSPSRPGSPAGSAMAFIPASDTSASISTPVIAEEPLAVFANPKASWEQIDHAVSSLSDAEIISLVGDKAAQAKFADSNREALNYFFYHRIGRAEPVATLIEQLGAPIESADLEDSIKSEIKRAGHIGWILARGRSESKSFLAEAASQYGFTAYLNFTRAYCATGIGSSPASDFADAFAAGQAKFGSQQSYPQLMVLYTALGWSHVRPRDAIDFILSQKWPEPSARSEALKWCIQIVDFFDPQLARELLEKSFSSIGGYRIATLCMELQLKDVQSVFDRLAPDERASFVRSLAQGGYDSGQAYEASQICMALDPAKLDDSEVKDIGTALFRTVPDTAAGWFLRIPADQRDAVVTAAFQNNNSSQGAQLYLDLNTAATGTDGNLITRAAFTLANANPEKARAEIGKFSPDVQAELEKSVMHAEAGYLLHSKPEELSTFFDKVPGDLRQKYTSDLASWWAQMSPENALQWAKNLSDPALRETAESQVLANGNLPAEQREQETLDAIQRTGRPGDYHDQLNNVISQYVQTDPSKAVDCIGKVTDPGLNQQLTADLARSWCDSDPEAASTWISTLPAGAARDEAVATYVRAIPDDPDAALQSANSITDPALRMQAAATVVAAWANVDKSYAATLLAGSNLSADDKAAIAQRTNVALPPPPPPPPPGN